MSNESHTATPPSNGLDKTLITFAVLLASLGIIAVFSTLLSVWVVF
ncbi:hypothetical protein [Falsiruegeria mediterranea]|jgi:hypothetical protein|uniref:Uncharacterized protein n=1 Tax=Falsiruegeria mediterranea M17 TaxID=1200281 RepID=A0A2R8C6C4_9RHOB|nr:hypothetical protein [Falsiruegeria mediterranea]SPJ27994.1 hypothetical protein TRM7615_01489 [Falsiruegeria mediterranea M17]